MTKLRQDNLTRDMGHLIICALTLLCPFCLTAQNREVMILHTSDSHSCIEPISPNYSDTAMADKGGFIRRAALISDIRKEYDGKVLLLDCGDFSQGSAYYTLFKGDVEVALMNEMGYDACAIGNHEFDYGLDNLSRLMRTARFPFVCCNYDFRGTPCEGLAKPYVTKVCAGVKIGIFGVSPKPDGLVSKANYDGMKYTNPAKAAQPVIDRLRNEEKCDIVVCLSHLGWDIGSNDDQSLVSATTGIDILLGGHTHTYFEHLQHLTDKAGHEVIVEHMGKHARFVGAMKVEVE